MNGMSHRELMHVCIIFFVCGRPRRFHSPTHPSLTIASVHNFSPFFRSPTPTSLGHHIWMNPFENFILLLGDFNAEETEPSLLNIWSNMQQEML